jgi:hypothetical protein
MPDVTLQQLLHSIRQYYPAGFPHELDPHTQTPPPYQLTPEFQRWQAAWTRFIEEEPQPWERILEGLETELPGHEFGGHTPAYHSACYFALLYRRTPPSGGQEGYRLVRVAGAVSLIAPVYLVYGTLEWVSPRPAPLPKPQLFLRPTEEMRSDAALMARRIEAVLGYHPFPLELAEVPVPDVRVYHLHHDEQPTLLSALFQSGLEYLP